MRTKQEIKKRQPLDKAGRKYSKFISQDQLNKVNNIEPMAILCYNWLCQLNKVNK